MTKDYDYDAFGVERNALATDANPFRYCGEQFDGETGNYYLRARYYSPEVGRFTQEDLARDGTNWYTYCANAPTLFSDPTGMWLSTDINLSAGAQEYTKYYGGKWTEANVHYTSATTVEARELALNVRDYWHNLANSIRFMDTKGLVESHLYDVPVFTGWTDFFEYHAHMVVISGMVMAPGVSPLVRTNNPWNLQYTQTYEEFFTIPDPGRRNMTWSRTFRPL